MDCADAKLRMETYATGNLASPDREEFEKHVADCEGCRLELDLTRAGFGVNRPDAPAPAPEPPPAGDFIRSGDAGFPAGGAFGTSSGVDETGFADVASELSQEFSPGDIEHTAPPVPGDPETPEAHDEVTPISVERARPVADAPPPPSEETTPPPAAAGSRFDGGSTTASPGPGPTPGAGGYSLDALLANATPSGPSRSESAADALARAIPGGPHAAPGTRKGWEFEPAEGGGASPPSERSLFFAEEALARARDAGARRKGGAVKLAAWVAGVGAGVALLALAIWIAFRPHAAEDLARMAAERYQPRPAETAAPPSASTPTPAAGVPTSGGEETTPPSAPASGPVAAETDGGGASAPPPAASAPPPSPASAPGPSSAGPASASQEVVSASATSQPSVLPDAARPVPPPEPPKTSTAPARSTRAPVATGHHAVSTAPRTTASAGSVRESKAVRTPPPSTVASAPDEAKASPKAAAAAPPRARQPAVESPAAGSEPTGATAEAAPTAPPAAPEPAAPAPGARTPEPAVSSSPAAPAAQPAPATEPSRAVHAAPAAGSRATEPPPPAGTGAASSSPKPGAEASAAPKRPIDRLHLATLAAERRGDLGALRNMRDTWKDFMKSGVGPDRIRAKRELADCLWAIQALTGKKSDQRDALRAYRDYLLNAPAGGADSRSVSRTKQLQDALSEY